MKNLGWPVLLVALLLGLVTGDFVVSAQSKPSKQEVSAATQTLSPLSWQGEYGFLNK